MQPEDVMRRGDVMWWGWVQWVMADAAGDAMGNGWDGQVFACQYRARGDAMGNGGWAMRQGMQCGRVGAMGDGGCGWGCDGRQAGWPGLHLPISRRCMCACPLTAQACIPVQEMRMLDNVGDEEMEMYAPLYVLHASSFAHSLLGLDSIHHRAFESSSCCVQVVGGHYGQQCC